MEFRKAVRHIGDLCSPIVYRSLERDLAALFDLLANPFTMPQIVRTEQYNRLRGRYRFYRTPIRYKLPFIRRGHDDLVGKLKFVLDTRDVSTVDSYDLHKRRLERS